MPENPIDDVASAQQALRALEGLLALAEGSDNGTPDPTSIAAILSPISSLLEGALPRLESASTRRTFAHLRPVS